MPERDVFSWTTIIGGYAILGCHEEAIKLFQEMLRVGPEPNEATIVNVLSACSSNGALASGEWVYTYLSSRPDFPLDGPVGNAQINMFVKCGDVDKAIHVYNKLESKDIITWSTITTGLLEKAEAFIRAMPVEADGSVWGALLNACKIHGNEIMFERVRKRLVGSRSVSVGTLALLSNAYAGCERWEDANRVRDEMRLGGLKKMAGSSWVEVSPVINGDEVELTSASLG
ncbi:hypothetical protein CRG98_037099 [Punica granatum]|uniref:Pentatricopeptide repeat-containing protein n=1 Tax=Punica granatum TaxID=22663 RepID=A0A2I0IFM8_PUNGR|nr:hypothetical protein CRG98_037099 [Punica granatum]